jgi:hypothetical protein
MPDDTFDLLVNDPNTGLPESLQVSATALRDTLVNNPAVLVGALRTVLERKLGQEPGQGLRIANNSPITSLVGPAEVNRLSPTARNLTRGDLMALAGWGNVAKKDPSEYNLTVSDIQTLRDIFGGQLDSELALQDVTISCCCCSPCCCCAVAVVEPVRSVA